MYVVVSIAPLPPKLHLVCGSRSQCLVVRCVRSRSLSGLFRPVSGLREDTQDPRAAVCQRCPAVPSVGVSHALRFYLCLVNIHMRHHHDPGAVRQVLGCPGVHVCRVLPVRPLDAPDQLSDVSDCRLAAGRLPLYIRRHDAYVCRDRHRLRGKLHTNCPSSFAPSNGETPCPSYRPRLST